MILFSKSWVRNSILGIGFVHQALRNRLCFCRSLVLYVTCVLHLIRLLHLHLVIAAVVAANAVHVFFAVQLPPLPPFVALVRLLAKWQLKWSTRKDGRSGFVHKIFTLFEKSEQQIKRLICCQFCSSSVAFFSFSFSGKSCALALTFSIFKVRFLLLSPFSPHFFLLLRTQPATYLRSCTRSLSPFQFCCRVSSS